MISYFCSIPEQKLINDIQAIGYGEIYNISHEKGPPFGSIQIDPRFARLLKYLRSGCAFDRIVIYDSKPTIGERRGKTEGGRDYIQKYKF